MQSTKNLYSGAQDRHGCYPNSPELVIEDSLPSVPVVIRYLVDKSAHVEHEKGDERLWSTCLLSVCQ